MIFLKVSYIVVVVFTIILFFSALLFFEEEIFVEENDLVFAIIGDYGTDDESEKLVSELVHSWEPDFIITTGDNNYPSGSSETIDENIGKYYSDFIGEYKGKYGKGSQINKMFPTLGNHDWVTQVDGLPRPYLEYFSVLEEHNETSKNIMYYDFIKGPIHFFAIDSDDHQPDGNTENSIQGKWLFEQLNSSTSIFNLVYFHHSPFTNTIHKVPKMDWPFREWGADIVINGHSHSYERFEKNGITYVVNGLGGFIPHCFPGDEEGFCRNKATGTFDPDTIIAYNKNVGAMLVKANDKYMTFTFIDVNQTKIDSFKIYAES